MNRIWILLPVAALAVVGCNSNKSGGNGSNATAPAGANSAAPTTAAPTSTRDALVGRWGPEPILGRGGYDCARITEFKPDGTMTADGMPGTWEIVGSGDQMELAMDFTGTIDRQRLSDVTADNFTLTRPGPQGPRRMGRCR